MSHSKWLISLNIFKNSASKGFDRFRISLIFVCFFARSRTERRLKRHLPLGAKDTKFNSCKCVVNVVIKSVYEFQTLKAPIKLSRKMAIFEFSSSNGHSSFSINFECRSIQIIEDEYNNHLSYLVRLTSGLQSDTSCDERGHEWATNAATTVTNAATAVSYRECITSVQG